MVWWKCGVVLLRDDVVLYAGEYWEFPLSGSPVGPKPALGVESCNKHRFSRVQEDSNTRMLKTLRPLPSDGAPALRPLRPVLPGNATGAK